MAGPPASPGTHAPAARVDREACAQIVEERVKIAAGVRLHAASRRGSCARCDGMHSSIDSKFLLSASGVAAGDAGDGGGDGGRHSGGAKVGRGQGLDGR